VIEAWGAAALTFLRPQVTGTNAYRVMSGWHAGGGGEE
jgi:hypothetical protein